MQHDSCPRKEQISYRLLSLVYALMEVDKKIQYYGTDEQLTVAEIHMIKAVRENEGMHVTGLAERLNVTKGAVSQLLTKLERKGMLAKHRDPQNLSRLVLELTRKGATAYENHEQFHGKFDIYVEMILKDATTANRTFLSDFIETLLQRIEKFRTEIG